MTQDKKIHFFQVHLFPQYSHYQISTEIFLKIGKKILKCVWKVIGQDFSQEGFEEQQYGTYHMSGLNIKV